MNKKFKYGHQTLEELKISKQKSPRNWFLRVFAVCAVVVMLILIALVITSCTVNLNIGGDGQPGQVVYQHADDSVTE